MNSFDNYWERCIRELGVCAMDPKEVGRWGFQQLQKFTNNSNSVRCPEDGGAHEWADRPASPPAFPRPAIACKKCGKAIYHEPDL